MTIEDHVVSILELADAYEKALAPKSVGRSRRKEREKRVEGKGGGGNYDPIIPAVIDYFSNGRDDRVLNSCVANATAMKPHFQRVIYNLKNLVEGMGPERVLSGRRFDLSNADGVAWVRARTHLEIVHPSGETSWVYIHFSQDHLSDTRLAAFAAVLRAGAQDGALLTPSVRILEPRRGLDVSADALEIPTLEELRELARMFREGWRRG